MSGGSMDYLYSKIENLGVFSEHTPERRAFAAHLKLVCQALHDIEWVDSCDMAAGAEDDAIRKCIGNGPVLQAALDGAREAAATLAKEIERAEGLHGSGRIHN